MVLVVIQVDTGLSLRWCNCLLGISFFKGSRMKLIQNQQVSFEARNLKCSHAKQ